MICQSCQGSGLIHIMFDSFQCSACRGAGVITQERLDELQAIADAQLKSDKKG